MSRAVKDIRRGMCGGGKMADGGAVDDGQMNSDMPMDGYAHGGGIHIKPSHKGLLHEDLGVPAGSPIPAKKLAAAKNSDDPAERKRATFAANAKKWNHG